MKNRFEKNGQQKNKMDDSANLRARDLKFLPKILKKYLKNRIEKNGRQKNEMADKKKTKWPAQPFYELET